MKRELLLSPLPAGKLPPWLLRKVIPAPTSDAQVLVGPGIGRDAAAIAVGDQVIVAKTDPITFASEGGATHLVEVNANDVACMGATPRWLLVTSLLPEGVTPADVLRDFTALREACRHRSVEIVGGHTEIVPGLTKPILVGMMPLREKLGVHAMDLLAEKKLQGSLMGSNRFPLDIPRLVDFYLAGRLDLDSLVAERIDLGQVNEAMEKLRIGESARSVIVFD